MHSASLPLYTPTSSILTTNRNRNRNPKPKAFSFYPATVQKSYGNSFICKASTTSSSITDFDLYDLLGIDSSSDRSQIKMAYRTLQKRCHPDIAGQAGHDMAIILNEAYAVLSNPNSRLAYDKEQGKVAELRGYTGKPIYSAWFGSENEERAVFVDEVKCVGCLKCALFAEKTFAIESVYGRARVVAQWADPEHKIQEAIEACPVDCISMVERSNLAALEFLMSKQPRGNVRVGAGNTGGIRVSNIFVDVDKFQARFTDAMDKATQHSKESDPQREARMSAIQAIRSISNWLYWQSPSSEGRPSSRSRSLQNLPCSAKKSTEPNINKLRDAAAAIKQARENPKTISSNYIYDDDEYWIQSTLTLPEATPHYHEAGSTTTTPTTPKISNKEDFVMQKNTRRSNPFIHLGVPMGTAAVAAVIVMVQIGQGASGGLKEHIGGSLVLELVNSSWSQVVLAAITWYLIGVYVAELVDALRSKLGMYKK